MWNLHLTHYTFSRFSKTTPIQILISCIYIHGNWWCPLVIPQTNRLTNGRKWPTLLPKTQFTQTIIIISTNKWIAMHSYVKICTIYYCLMTIVFTAHYCILGVWVNMVTIGWGAFIKWKIARFHISRFIMFRTRGLYGKYLARDKNDNIFLSGLNTFVASLAKTRCVF